MIRTRSDTVFIKLRKLEVRKLTSIYATIVVEMVV